MEHLIDSIEGLFKEDLYQGFPEHVSVDEYIDLVADYIEDDCLGAGYLRGLKGKSLREIENIVLSTFYYTTQIITNQQFRYKK